jgi:Uma2 family endonuclease
MSYSAALEPIIHSSVLPQLIDELNKYWEDEQNRRLDFYNWITPQIKAEFIEGEIIVNSPVRSKHNIVLRNALFIAETCWRKAKQGYIGVEKIMTRFTRNDYEPDICYFKGNYLALLGKELNLS